MTPWCAVIRPTSKGGALNGREFSTTRIFSQAGRQHRSRGVTKPALTFLVTALAGWISRQQQEVIENRYRWLRSVSSSHAKSSSVPR